MRRTPARTTSSKSCQQVPSSSAITPPLEVTSQRSLVKRSTTLLKRFAEVHLAHSLVAQQAFRRVGDDDATVLHDVAPVRQPQGLCCVLLDEQDGRATVANVADDLKDGLDD